MREIYGRYSANGRSVLETARNYTQQACMHFKYGSRLVQSVQHPPDDVRKPLRSYFNRNKSFSHSNGTLAEMTSATLTTAAVCATHARVCARV